MCELSDEEFEEGKKRILEQMHIARNYALEASKLREFRELSPAAFCMAIIVMSESAKEEWPELYPKMVELLDLDNQPRLKKAPKITVIEPQPGYRVEN